MRQCVYTAQRSSYDACMLKHSLTLGLPVLALTVLAGASPVMAQAAPSAAPAQSSLVSYGIAVLAVIAVIALSVMSAKRTHQD